MKPCGGLQGKVGNKEDSMDQDTGCKCNGQCEECKDRAAGCNPLSRSLGLLMAGFVKSLEVIMNTGNVSLLCEFETVVMDAFKQARQALAEGRRPLN